MANDVVPDEELADLPMADEPQAKHEAKETERDEVKELSREVKVSRLKRQKRKLSEEDTEIARSERETSAEEKRLKTEERKLALEERKRRLEDSKFKEDINVFEKNATFRKAKIVTQNLAQVVPSNRQDNRPNFFGGMTNNSIRRVEPNQHPLIASQEAMRSRHGNPYQMPSPGRHPVLASQQSRRADYFRRPSSPMGGNAPRANYWGKPSIPGSRLLPNRNKRSRRVY